MTQLIKIKILFLIMLIVNTLAFADDKADDSSWELYHMKIFFENDIFAQTDNQYTSGEKINLTYHVENPTAPIYDLLISSGSASDIFTSFSFANQIYTPEDLLTSKLILDDRPYAGWTYLEAGIHKSTKDSLNTILLKVGMVGPSSQSENIQKQIHELSGSDEPMGWNNQLKDELGVNLTYAYKWRFTHETEGGFQSSYIPYIEADLGNVSTGAAVGIFARFGWNIAKDFGISTLDNNGESGIPIYDEQKISIKRDWSFSFNFILTGSVVVRDIFLDGNTFKDSHSISKNPLVGYAGAGISTRYKSFVFDFMQTVNTNKFDKEGKRDAVGTVLVTWLF